MSADTIGEIPRTRPNFDVIVGGGGMRGYFSFGAIQRTWEMGQDGALPTVDRFYTASAGIGTALGYVHPEGPEHYSEALLDMVPERGIVFNRFMDKWRVWKMADIKYAVNKAFLPNFPVEELETTETEIIASMMDAETGKIDYKRLTPDNIEQVLMATMAAPIMYNRTVRLDGRRYVDAAIKETAPLAQQVHERGMEFGGPAGEIAVTGLILARGLDDISGNWSKKERLAISLWPMWENVRKAMKEASSRDLDVMYRAQVGETWIGPLVTTTPGPEFSDFDRQETDPDELRRMIAEGKLKGIPFANELKYHIDLLSAKAA